MLPCYDPLRKLETNPVGCITFSVFRLERQALLTDRPYELNYFLPLIHRVELFVKNHHHP